MPSIFAIRIPLFVWLLAAALMSLPATGLAEEPPGPASVGPRPTADAPQIEHFEYWRARGAVARGHVAATQSRLDEANAAVARMQRRGHPRGEARQRLREEQASARAAHEATTHVLEVELPAEATAAGAQLRWLRVQS